jgi:hypothetical protein
VSLVYEKVPPSICRFSSSSFPLTSWRVLP